MTLIDDIVKIARAELGLCETPNNGVANDGPPLERFAGGRVGDPWCAHFLCYVFRKAGCPLPGDVVPTRERPNPIALVTTMERELERAGWLTLGPTRGGIVCFAFPGDDDEPKQHHCGLVVEQDAINRRILTIEGNTDDGVHTRFRSNTTLRRFATSYAAIPLALLEGRNA